MVMESSLHTDQDRSTPAVTVSPYPRVPVSPCHLPWPRLLPALATGGLLWMCHFPLAWGWLAWVALVPLLCLVRAPVRARRIFFIAWAGGLVFFWPVLQWMRVADPRMYYTWAALATYCSLYLPVGVLLVRWLDRRTSLPLVVTVPVVWTALEFFRAHFGTGFPWYFLGHTQHAWLPVIQVADLAGAYAVTFLVAAVNALIFELLYTWGWFRRLFALPAEPCLPSRRALALQGAGVALLFAATLLYGLWRLGQDNFTLGPLVALIQGNLEQGVRNARSSPGPGAENAAGVMMGHYQNLNRLALKRGLKLDLIVWPETSYPSEWIELSEDFPAERINPLYRRPGGDGREPTAAELAEWRARMVRKLNEDILDDVKEWKTDALLGLNSRVLESENKSRRYNSAVLIREDGQFDGRYDKIHRVPFGEYVPFRDWLPWMNRFAPYDFDYSVSTGEQMTRFALGDYHFGVLICYEDTDPYLARQYVRPGGEPMADFLVNISNDGWFDGTSEHEEHLAICRFRAVECRRSVARAVNMGISAVIDGNGRVMEPYSTEYLEQEDVYLWSLIDPRRLHPGIVELPPLNPWPLRWFRPWGEVRPIGQARDLPLSRWHEFKKVQGVLTAEIPLDRRTSLYAQWGDWLPWSCWVLIGVGLVWGIVRSRQEKAPDNQS
ncbi:MAG TPA: apolipoprotein N-acyltransferase [Gemmataceae bacterium]|nr:apolipoprotein N-acyltransferase [Gemmataceae bacterium]